MHFANASVLLLNLTMRWAFVMGSAGLLEIADNGPPDLLYHLLDSTSCCNTAHQ